MNRQNSGWGIAILLVIVILVILFWPKGCACSPSQQSLSQASKDSLFTQAVKDAVQEALDSCKAKKPSIAGSTGGSSFSYFYSVPAPKEAPSYKENPSPKETKSYAEDPTPVKKDQPSVNRETLDQIYYEGTDKNIYFCLNYGGNPAWFLPHLALVNGEGITAQKNNQGGYNWVVGDHQLSSGFSGDWGVTRDGTFFVSCSLIDRNNPGSDQLYILTTATGWAPKPMQRSGSYYIWKR